VKRLGGRLGDDDDRDAGGVIQEFAEYKIIGPVREPVWRDALGCEAPEGRLFHEVW